MKIICLLLIITVLMLSTVPCCFEDNCVNEIETAQDANHPQNSEQDEYNICSPFATCGICSGFVHQNFEFFYVNFSTNKLIPHYNSPFIKNIIAEIWKPPEIS